MHPSPTHPTASRATRRLFAAALCAFTVACGGAQSRGDAPVDALVFEPMVIHAAADADGNDRTIVATLPDLFAEAGDYFRADDYEDAIRLYDVLLAHFDDEEYARAATYNRALSYEALGDWERAADGYRALIATWPATPDATDAHFRLAECESQLENWAVVMPIMQRVLARIGLTVEQTVEGHLRMGNAALELRRFDEAAAHYRDAIRTNDRARLSWNPESSPHTEEPLDAGDPLIGQTYFSLGRVYHELFSDIRLVLPEERLTADLVDKTQLFEQAQDAYLDAVRTGDAYWSPAAGYMVGQLFEDYYFDVLATEVPDDFNALEVEVYFEELRAFVEPAMRRALSVYEHNLAMAYRLGAQGPWVDDTLASVERVHLYLEAQDGWADEHAAIVEGRHPHSAPRVRHELAQPTPHPAP